jgi:arginine decarboxylase
MFYVLCQRVRERLEQLEFIPKELQELSQSLAETYYANFSLFQSLPDNWAIDQLFPLMPIHRLLEKPTAQGTLGDITCDSDGCIVNFVGPNGKRKTLPLHPMQKDEPYWLGIFLVGAYQEVLGDYHNLLGRLHVLTVDADANDRMMVFTRRGTVVSEALELVNHTPEDVMRGVRSMIHSAVNEKRVSTVEAQSSSRFFQRLATEYTYLTDDLDAPSEVALTRVVEERVIGTFVNPPVASLDFVHEPESSGDIEEYVAVDG